MSPRTLNRRGFLAAGATGAAALLRPGPAWPLGRVARPRPTPSQLLWQRDELALFLHYGVNTFTDREWGDGTESPSIFNPSALDARSTSTLVRATV